MTQLQRYTVGLSLAVLTWWAAAVHGQTPAPAAPAPADAAAAAVSDSATPEAVTAEAIKARIEQLQADNQTPAVARDQAVELYRAALSRLDAARASQAGAQKFELAIKTAPDAAAAITAEIKAAAEKPPAPPDTTNTPLADLEQQLVTMQAAAATTQNQLNDLEQSLRDMAQRPITLQQDLTAARAKLAELEKPKPAGDQPVVVAEAQRVAAATQRAALSAQMNALEQELASLPARQKLAAARREQALAQLDAGKKAAEALRVVVSDRRQAAAEMKQAEAQRTAREQIGKHPLLVEYAGASEQLSRDLLGVTQRIDEISHVQASVKAETQEVEENQRSANDILDIGGGGEEFSQLLRELRAKLATAGTHRRQIQLLEREMIDARLQRLRLDEQLRTTANPESAVLTILQQRALRLPKEPPLSVEARATLTELVEARRETVKQLADAQAQRLKQLAELKGRELELAAQTQALALRLDERLLWLPSAPEIGATWPSDIFAGVQWLMSPGQWRVVLDEGLANAAASPLLPAGVLALFAVLMVVRGRLRRRMQSITQAVKRTLSDGFLLTVEALAISFLLALPWPLLLGGLGTLLSTGRDASLITVAVGRGFFSAARVAFILRSIHTMCRDDGLFGVHFGWTDRARRVLGRNLWWLIGLEAAAAFLVVATVSSSEPTYLNGLGRLAFLAGSVGLSVFAYFVFDPTRGTVAEFIPSKNHWAYRLRHFWFPPSVAIPSLLACAAAMGYLAPAMQVQGRLFTSAWVALVGLVVYSLAMRWLVVAQRRLAIQRAREKRAKAQAEAAKTAATEAAGEAAPLKLDVPQIDLSSVSRQTQTLLRAIVTVGIVGSLWLVWQEVIPALNILNDITLWHHTLVIDGGTKNVSVTLAQLVLAIVVGAFTLVAARNLPGVLEITTLRRLTIDAGTRYAIAAISRYLIIVAGMLIAVDQIGVNWAQMQWIIAALGVGLGFGLQEIVANFVSGLIILFERPIRVGDTVTVNDLSGTVSRIQIRATTIVDWDNREIIVPNKAFITDRVVNWTLTEPVTRLVLKVGIAYGSDTVLAHKVLMEAAKSVSLIVQDPPPTVFFLSFGDSSLNYEVRVFVPGVLSRMPAMHELHMAVDRALREAKIEIPFPQRDLHLRSAPAELRVTGPGEPPAEPDKPDEARQ